MIRLCLKAGLLFFILLYVMDVKNKRTLFPSEVSVRNRHLCCVLQHLTGSLTSEIMQSSGGLSSTCIIQGHCDSTCVAKHMDRELPGAEPSEGGWRVTGELWARKKQDNTLLGTTGKKDQHRVNVQNSSGEIKSHIKSPFPKNINLLLK